MHRMLCIDSVAWYSQHNVLLPASTIFQSLSSERGVILSVCLEVIHLRKVHLLNMYYSAWYQGQLGVTTILYLQQVTCWKPCYIRLTNLHRAPSSSRSSMHCLQDKESAGRHPARILLSPRYEKIKMTLTYLHSSNPFQGTPRCDALDFRGRELLAPVLSWMLIDKT